MPRERISYSTLLSELEDIENFKELYNADELGNFKDIVGSNQFYEYVLKEFEKTIVYATIDDLSTFAFGSLEEALIDYLKKKISSE